MIAQLREGVCGGYFGLSASGLRFTGCHFSLVTTPSEKLDPHGNSIPHVDSRFSQRELAFVHYLFRDESRRDPFYRHRKTGYEYIDESKVEYWRGRWNSKRMAPIARRARYIKGDTPLYEQARDQEGVYNRILIYSRNSLHSGAIPKNFIPDPNPRTGRLSVNGFLA